MTIDKGSPKPLSKCGDISLDNLERMASSLLEIIGIGSVNGKIKLDVLMHGITAPSSGIQADVGNSGDDLGSIGGTYTGTYDVVWNVEVTLGGAYGVGTIEIKESNGSLVKSYTPTSGTAESIANGITFTITDGGDTVLTLGDKWIITNTAGDIKPIRVDTDGKIIAA